MPESEPPGELWSGDVNEAVVEDWTDDTTTHDRVRQVVDVTTTPQSAREIADRARVSEPTARKFLETMRENGRVKAISTDSGTRYMRSPQAVALKRISAIHREHSKTELRDAIQGLQDQIASLRDEHGVADVDELALELGAGDDGWRDVARWQQLEENLDVAQAALSLYDFDPDDSQTAAARVGTTRERGDDADDPDEVATGERGALGDESARSTS